MIAGLSICTIDNIKAQDYGKEGQQQFLVYTVSLQSICQQTPQYRQGSQGVLGGFGHVRRTGLSKKSQTAEKKYAQKLIAIIREAVMDWNTHLLILKGEE
jgi:hypothetical protein